MSDIKNTTYIFRNLKVYSSIEWLADNKKKYRSVFDKNDVSYIYARAAYTYVKEVQDSCAPRRKATTSSVDLCLIILPEA
jgi:hypothetical protein